MTGLDAGDTEAPAGLGPIGSGMPEERAVALGKVLDLVCELDRCGALDAMNGLLQNAISVEQVLLEEAVQPGHLRLGRNAVTLGMMLESLDPADVEALTQGVGRAVHAARLELDRDGAVHPWRLVGLLREPEVNRGVRTLLAFLRGLGSL